MNTTSPRGAPLLAVDAVTVAFGGLVAVDDAAFVANAGEITAVIGPNGAGKTTLLNVVSGFLRPDSGSIRFGGLDITGVAPDRIAQLGVSRTFQNVEIVPELTTAENVLVACRTPRHVPRRARRGHAAARVLAVLDQLGLAAHADVLAGDLSYGAAKLVALARLVVGDAALLLLDEPGAGLPAGQLAELGETLSRLAAEHGRTVVLIDHNMQLVLRYADRVVVMHHGRVMATGTPAEIRADPAVIDVYLGRVAPPEPVATPARVGSTRAGA